ncbi:MAG: DUF2312 domain-containing protein [Sulfuricaulis sp.]|nr:DUF2312 domain-containing protein [Sulfuricaulis sp.]
MARKNTGPKEAKIGDNGGPLNDERKKKLAGYISEIERWEGEKATIQADVGLIFNAAKDAGFDTKAMRAVIKDRKKSKAEREAFDAVCDAYRHALGMLADLPLGQAAMARDGVPSMADPPFAAPPADWRQPTG